MSRIYLYKSEMIWVASKVKELTGKIDTNNENESIMSGVSLILFWSVFLLGHLKTRSRIFTTKR